jgi:ABC-2 type transport system permease protein
MTKHFFGDTAVLLGRSLRHITRSMDTIITTTIMPIAFISQISSSRARRTGSR